MERIATLAQNLPADWRLATAARFVPVLESFTDKLKAIKTIRELTGMGLGDAAAFVEVGPRRFPFAQLPKVPMDWCVTSKRAHCELMPT